MPDTQLLQMALIGYEPGLQKIQAKIDEIKARLNGRCSVGCDCCSG